MRSKQKQEPESIIREIKRKTRRKFTSEEKIRIVLEGLQGESAGYLGAAGDSGR